MYPPHYLRLRTLHKSYGPAPGEVPLPLASQVRRAALQKDLPHNGGLVVLILLRDHNLAIPQFALQVLESLRPGVGETQFLARCHGGQILNGTLDFTQHLHRTHHQVVVLAILLRPIGPIQDHIEHFGVVMQGAFQAVVENHFVKGQLVGRQFHFCGIFTAQLVGSFGGRNGGIYLGFFLNNQRINIKIKQEIISNTSVVLSGLGLRLIQILMSPDCFTASLSVSAAA